MKTKQNRKNNYLCLYKVQQCLGSNNSPCPQQKLVFFGIFLKTTQRAVRLLVPLCFFLFSVFPFFPFSFVRSFFFCVRFCPLPRAIKQKQAILAKKRSTTNTRQSRDVSPPPSTHPPTTSPYPNHSHPITRPHSFIPFGVHAPRCTRRLLL